MYRPTQLTLSLQQPFSTMSNYIMSPSVPQIKSHLSASPSISLSSRQCAFNWVRGSICECTYHSQIRNCNWPNCTSFQFSLPHSDPRGSHNRLIGPQVRIKRAPSTFDFARFRHSSLKMGTKRVSSRPVSASVWLLLVMVAALASLSSSAVQAQLATNFYKNSCPNAENVITSAVNSALNRRAAAAAGVLRIHFHDCFVHGCDASVLIDSPSEKDARPNLSLQGFEIIDAAKTAIEKQCPGVVSCADITAMASQLSVKKLSGGRITWKVPLGRRDGMVSSAADVTGKLPSPTANVATLKAIFAGVGLSTDEMVTLSGAHSVGVAGCGTIQNRLTTPPDATLDATYAAVLKKQCPQGSTSTVNLDLTTPTRLDEVYYKNLQARKGLLTSDQALQEDSETRPLVAQLTNVITFNSKFAAAMTKMDNIGVLTGTQGEIRLNCRRFN